MILIAAAGALALLYWGRFCAAPPSGLRSVVKTGAVLVLAVAAALGGGPGLLVVALALCALGDLMLSRPGEAAFMAGVGAFAAGHLAYIALFLTHAGGALPAAPPVAGLLVLGAVMAAVLWPRAGALRWPVMGYIPVILGMGVAALTVPGTGALALVLPGATLFILSDLVLALENFVLMDKHSARHVTPYVVWPTYWAAQALFTLAFVPALAV